MYDAIDIIYIAQIKRISANSFQRNQYFPVHLSVEFEQWFLLPTAAYSTFTSVPYNLFHLDQTHNSQYDCCDNVIHE